MIWQVAIVAFTIMVTFGVFIFGIVEASIQWSEKGHRGIAATIVLVIMLVASLILGLTFQLGNNWGWH